MRLWRVFCRYLQKIPPVVTLSLSLISPHPLSLSLCLCVFVYMKFVCACLGFPAPVCHIFSPSCLLQPLLPLIVVSISAQGFALVSLRFYRSFLRCNSLSSPAFVPLVWVLILLVWPFRVFSPPLVHGHLQVFGAYGEGDWDFARHGYPYLTIVDNVSITVWCLGDVNSCSLPPSRRHKWDVSV